MANLKLIILLVGVVFVMISGCFEQEQKEVVKPQSQINMVDGGNQDQPQVSNSIMGTWQVSGKGHSGTVRFKPDGYADISSDLFSGSITYEETAKNIYKASYMWYSITVIYNPTTDTLTSSDQPVVEFKRVI
jgi:hypothetical protein